VRTGFVGFQQDVDDALPGGPRGTARAGSQLPEQGSLGELLVLGDCGGLYWSDSRVWHPLERGEGTGHFRLRVRFPSASRGDEPVLSVGTGTEQNVLRVRYLADGDARFVLDSPVAPSTLVGGRIRIDPGRAYALNVMLDSRVGHVRVSLDDEPVLDAITFLAPGDEVMIGATADPSAPARFSGTIRQLPVPTPLCDFVRSRYQP
jgi:hypothetical protein